MAFVWFGDMVLSRGSWRGGLCRKLSLLAPLSAITGEGKDTESVKKITSVPTFDQTSLWKWLKLSEERQFQNFSI